MSVPGPKRSLTTDCDEPESKQVPSSDTPSHTVTESALANKSAQECNVNSISTSTTILAVVASAARMFSKRPDTNLSQDTMIQMLHEVP